MKRQKQLYRHDPANNVFGDCHRTAVAALFDLDAHQVPHFADGGAEAHEFNLRIDEWLAERNLAQVNIGFACGLEDILNTVAAYNGDIWFLLGGTSKNGTHHTVLCHAGKIALDPSQDDSGIVGPMDDGYFWLTFFVPVNHAAFAPGKAERSAGLLSEVA